MCGHSRFSAKIGIVINDETFLDEIGEFDACDSEVGSFKPNIVVPR